MRKGYAWGAGREEEGGRKGSTGNRMSIEMKFTTWKQAEAETSSSAARAERKNTLQTSQFTY